MTGPGLTLFDTAVGRCGIAWGTRGIVGVQLPEASDRATRARLLARVRGAAGEAAPDRAAYEAQSPRGVDARDGESLPGMDAHAERRPDAGSQLPPAVRHARDGIVALMSGEPIDLTDVVLDMDGVPPFHRSVYEVARTIPPGQTLTYGEVAKRVGEPDAARAVGQALGRNPFAIVVPCHRVLAAGGKVGGFSAGGGVSTKRRMLEIEGALAAEPPTLFGDRLGA